MTPEQLSKLSREQKLALFDMIEEKKRRLRESAMVYTPNEGQMLVHQSEKPIRGVFAGNAGGKSTLAANECLWWAAGYSPVTKRFTKTPARIIVLVDHPNKVDDAFLPEMQKWHNFDAEKQFHKRGRPNISQITFPNGSEILFMSHEMAPLAFESIECEYVICDEPPPRQIWISLQRAARRKGRAPKFLIVATPISGTWMRTEIFDPWQKGERDDVECFRFGTVVNEKNLADGYIERFSKALTAKEKKIRLEGFWFDLDGLALAHLFKTATHVIPPYHFPETSPAVLAIDPHPSKKHHAVLLGSTQDGGLIYIKETAQKMVSRQFANHLKEFTRGYRVIDMVCDSLGSADGTGGEGFKSFITILNEEGVRARATTWTEKNDESFIERIRDILTLPEEANNFGQRVPKLRIMDGNPGIVSDIENVQWQKYRDVDIAKPKLDITNTDYLSCLKYALATSLHYDKEKAKIYHRKELPATYGIQQPASKAFFRRVLNGHEKPASRRKIFARAKRPTDKADDEDW